MRKPWTGELSKAWKRAFDSLGGRKLVVEMPDRHVIGPWKMSKNEMRKRFKNMDIFERAAGFLRPRLCKQIFVSLLPFALLFAGRPQNLSAQHGFVC